MRPIITNIVSILANIWVTYISIVNKNFRIPAKPALRIMPASIVLASEETSTCTASNQK